MAVYHLVLLTLSARDSARARRAALVEPEIGGAAPERFWIIVPCLNEERVVGRTVSAALALAGPAGTINRVLGGRRRLGRRHAVRPRRDRPPEPGGHAAGPAQCPKGKGEALNAAHRFIVNQTRAEGIDPHLVRRRRHRR
jgi:hypothetical protein